MKDGSSHISQGNLKICTDSEVLLHCTRGTHNLICILIHKLTAIKKCSRYKRYLGIPAWYLDCRFYR